MRESASACIRIFNQKAKHNKNHFQQRSGTIERISVVSVRSVVTPLRNSVEAGSQNRSSMPPRLRGEHAVPHIDEAAASDGREPRISALTVPTISVIIDPISANQRPFTTGSITPNF